MEVAVVSPQSLHVRVHRVREGYWAQVREWPGCFAGGVSWDELTAGIEEAVGLYMASGDDEGPTPVALRIREIEIEVDAEMPLIRAMAEDSVDPLSPMPRSRDPHPDWPLREFGSRDRTPHEILDAHLDDDDESALDKDAPGASSEEDRVGNYERIMIAEERLYEIWEKRGEGVTWVGELVGSSAQTDTVLWVKELGEKVAALGGQLELAAVFPNETVTLLIEPGPPGGPDASP
jgi:predicted RNase H-like HicB family nuclease